MATTTNHSAGAAAYIHDTDTQDDIESDSSIETDDGQYHLPEKIIAELKSKTGFVWYLVKWQDCPILRSSWEGSAVLESQPHIWENWKLEKQKQAQGSSKPLDIAAFNKAVLEVEKAEAQRHILRRLKRRVNRVLSIVSD